MPRLPTFVPPMLARLGRHPFDSAEHLFEVKWDGVRGLAFVEEDGLRLRSRRDVDLLPRYPELTILRELEPGLVLDGEIVLLVEGTPDFHALLSREQARGDLRIRTLARTTPVTYVAFDVLYRGFQPLLDRPLAERRRHLEEVLGGRQSARLALSAGIAGAGCVLFEQVQARGIEGIVAKRLDAAYLPGRRTDAWTKIKTGALIHCVLLGWIEEEDDLRSLILGANEEGRLTCVGRVGSGLHAELRKRLLPLLRARRRATPLVDCGMEGNWAEPGLFCRVRYLEKTPAGQLRAPVFLELLTE